MAVRRDKERPGDKDKGQDRSRDAGDNDRDSRDGWSIAEEKGGRRGGRDRRQDDARDRDDRNDREKEKEPAWMETYVPSSSSGGILGGKGAEGEIDSIQEWKLNMKRAERKALGLPEPEAPQPIRTSASSSSTPKSDGKKSDVKEVDSITQRKASMKATEEKVKAGAAAKEKAKALEPSPIQLQPTTSSAPVTTSEKPLVEKAPASMAEGQLDEIQLFKLMMKQEEKKRAVSGEYVSEDLSLPGEAKVTETAKSGLMRIREGRSSSAIGEINLRVIDIYRSFHQLATATEGQGPPTSLTDIAPILGDPISMSKSNLAVNAALGGAAKAPSPLSAPLLNTQSLGNIASSSTMNALESNGPRLLSSKTSESFLPPSDIHSLAKDANQQASFDPPRQSRLLAFGAQSMKAPAQPTPQSASAAAQMNRLQQLDPPWPGQRRPSVSPVMPQQSNPQQSNLDRFGGQGNQYDLGVIENMQRRPAAGALVSHGLPYDNRPLDIGELPGRDLGRNSISLATNADRAAFLAQAEALQQLNDIRRHPSPSNAPYNTTSPVSPFDSHLTGNQSSYSSGKGSRMAKHFERARDSSQGLPINRLNSAVLGVNGGVPNRQDHQMSNTGLGPPENRNIQDLLTMLNNSAQVCSL